jgi:hypothetical protein
MSQNKQAVLFAIIILAGYCWAFDMFLDSFL